MVDWLEKDKENPNIETQPTLQQSELAEPSNHVTVPAEVQ
jgi:hypothetical protein